MKTDNKTETTNYLINRANGKTECKDNSFFIDIEGKIIGHGYLQEDGEYFPAMPNGIEIYISEGMTKKDIIEQVNVAIKDNRYEI